MTFAHRVDRNHAEIVDAFRACGCSVHDTSSVRDGFPDLAVGIPGIKVNLLIEVKDGQASKSAQQLTPAERAFHEAWRGKVHIISSATQAFDLVSFYRGRLRRPA